MNNVLLLTKLFIKNGSGKPKVKQSAVVRIMAMLLVFGGLGGFLMYNIQKGAYVAYDFLSLMGQQDVIISIPLAIASFIIFIFGIVNILTYFYFTADLDNILPLPFKPYEIVTAKLMVVIVMQYVIEGLLLIPMIIGYGRASGGGVMFYLTSLIVFLLLPVVPLLFSLLLCMLLMSFSVLSKNKDKFRSAMGMFGIVIAFSANKIFEFFPSGVSNAAEAQDFANISTNSSLIRLSKIFYTAKFGTDSIVNSGSSKGTVSLLIFLALAIATYIFMCVISEKLYFKGAVGMSTASSKRKKFSEAEFVNNTKENSIVKTYVLKDLKIVFRTTAFLMTCVLRSLLVPIIMAVTFITNYNNLVKTGGSLSLDFSGSVGGTVLIVVLIMMILSSLTGNLASTTISRDGKNAFVMKYIPVDYTTQIMAKALSTFTINIFYVVVFSVLALVVKVPVLVVFYMLILGIVAIAFTSLVGTVVDARNPQLDWDNEYAAVRQNSNKWINLGINLICASFLYIPFKLGLSALPTFLMVLCIYLILVGIVVTYIQKNAEKIFAKMM